MQKKLLYTAILPALLWMLGGCSKGYLDINQSNPNQTENPPINALLANVTYQTGVNVYRAANTTSYYMQYLASPNQASSTDTYDNIDLSSLWFNIYDVIQDSRVMKQIAEGKNAFQHIAVADITEAMNMSLLIDMFGDAPYSEAWNKSILKPGYDNAEQIFNNCLSLLDEGIAELAKASPGVVLDGTSDFIHGGTASAWTKTAYALKARLLNRLSKTSNYNPAAILQALSKAYTSNNDDAQMTRFTARSPWNQSAYNNTVLLLDGWLSQQFVDALNGNTYGTVDPRLKYIATITKFGDYRGTVNGAGRVGTGTDDEESYLSLDGFYSKAGAPLLLVTYAEMKFIEAEAKFATDKAGAYQAYLDGIKANMDKIGVPSGERDTYLADANVAVGMNAFTKDLIFKEKYVAMFLQPEAWTDARRYDYKYKDFTMPQNAVLSSFVRRVGYPSTEESRNASNVPQVTGLDQKLWWDK